MGDTEAEKRQAGVAAADEVRDGMALGLGSGSTVFFFLEELGRRVQHGLRVVGVPTSSSTAELAGQFGIPLTTFDDRQELDLDVDGADEVDPDLNLIKGHGGALLREKIIAQAARRRLIIVDETKMSPQLGNAVLPVEVVPFARTLAERGLHQLGGQPRLRMAADAKPFVTDNGNWIVDCRFGPIPDPAWLEAEINRVPGVMENGLFVSLADEVVVAGESGVERLVRGVQTRA
ncbi:MAG: ribose-5-phosphate isomerase RpiA [Chloroflexi bacterium]|nr:ribose-5-phosphate isomerase RpiA [Chloroflexota bacterium]